MTVHLSPKPVDESEGSDAAVLLRVARFAADSYMLGPHGPYRNPKMSGADLTAGAVRAAVLQLLELGLVHPNAEVIAGQFSHPPARAEDM